MPTVTPEITVSLMSFLSQFFGSISESADGWSQSQREAIIDLLSIAIYADDHLSQIEGKSLDEEVEKLAWEANLSIATYLNDAINRARQAQINSGYMNEYVADIATRLGDRDARHDAYDICAKVIRSDGTEEKEKAFLEIVRNALNP